MKDTSKELNLELLNMVAGGILFSVVPDSNCDGKEGKKLTFSSKK